MAKIDLKADSVEELAKGKSPEEVKKQAQEKEAAKTKEVKEKGTEKKKAAKPRKIDQMEERDAMRIHAQRNTHSVERADKETKKELYSSEFVFVEDGEELAEADNAAKIRKEEYLELVSSAEEGRILKGVVESVQEVKTKQDRDDPSYIPDFVAKVKFKTGKFIVNIPSYVLYYYHYERMNRAMAMDIQKTMIKMIGAEIDFVVRYVDEKNGLAIADRLGSMSMRGVKYYTSINGAKPKVIPGMIVQGKIVAIAREYIKVDALGAECRIPLEEITWLHNADAREFDGIKTEENYKVGSKVNVKVLSVSTKRVKVVNSYYTLVDAKLSIKQAKPNPRIKYFDEFQIGDIYAGYITGITETGVYVNISNKMDCLCKFPKSGRMPVMGESVVVQIFAKDEEKKFIFGNIK